MTEGERQALVTLKLIGAACAAEIWRDLKVRQALQECRSGSKEHEQTARLEHVLAMVFWPQSIDDDFKKITASA
jgi:hypothetical protein